MRPLDNSSPEINIETVKSYVSQLLAENLPSNIYFHTPSHTEKILKTVKSLSKKAGLSKEEKEMLQIAALFHDIGFIDTYADHEAQSISIAEDYLRDENYPEEKIKIVKGLIDATRSDITPATPLQKFLCDADMSHLGKKHYFHSAELLRQEWEFNKENFNPSDIEWAEENFRLLQKHTFYTSVASDLYQKRKNKNVKKARKLLIELQNMENEKWETFSVAENKAALTIFKTSLRNHIDLTAIADQKSNMMLSVNAFILTVGLPIFASYLPRKMYLLAPFIVFMLTCISTMVFATLATRPMKMNGETDLSKIYSNNTNLFFFGNFYNMPLNAYHDAIKKVITHRETLNTSIINDLYFLGHSLGEKFRYLRICYNVFIIGIVLSVLSFFISYFLTA